MPNNLFASSGCSQGLLPNDRSALGVSNNTNENKTMEKTVSCVISNGFMASSVVVLI